MNTRIRFGLSTAAGLMAAGLVALALLAPAPLAGAAVTALTDAVGDTVTDPIEDPITAPRADIVSLSVDPTADGITFAARLQQLVDPMKDPNWASDASYLTWELDVTGDSKRDYKIEYTIDPESRKLSGFLYRFGGSLPDGMDCDPPASFSADAGYSVVVNPKCLANPAAFSYRLSAFYDTDAKSDDAEIATDNSPDQGWTGPISLTGAPVTPMTPQAASPGTPSASTPQSPSPSVAPATRGSTASPAPNTSVRPNPARGPRPAPNAGGKTDPAPALPDGALARTGPMRAVQLAEIAGALVLAGLSLMLAARRRPPLAAPRSE